MANGPTQGGNFGFGPGESPGPGGGPAEVDISPGAGYDEGFSLGVGPGLESESGLGEGGFDPGTGGAAGEAGTQTLQEYRAGFEQPTSAELFNLGQDLVQTIQEVTGVTVPQSIVSSLPYGSSVFNLPKHHKEKNRLENLLGEDSPAYNAAYREIARVAASLEETHGMSATEASILAHRDVNDRIEDGSFNPVIAIRPEDTQLDSLLDRAGAVPLANATEVPRIDGSDRGFTDEQGRVVPADQVMRNLAETAARGGTLGPNQIAIVRAMTPAERRAYGIFLGPDNTVRSLPEIFGAALINLNAGRPLSGNQQAVIGTIFNAIPSANDRRDAITQLSLTTGVDRATISDAVGPAMRSAVADTPASTMPSVVRRSILDAVGRERTFTTRAGKTVSAGQVVDNALRNLEAGRPLTANQQRVIQIWNKSVTDFYGDKLDPSRPRSPNVEDIRDRQMTPPQRFLSRLRSIFASPGDLQRDTPLSRSAREAAERILRDAEVRGGYVNAVPVGMPLFQTRTGQSRTTEQVLQNAIENQARGRPLTANQRQLLRALEPTFTTESGETRTHTQVLANAQRNLAAGKPLTANQRLALRREPNAAALRPSVKQATYKTAKGQTRTQAEVIANARANLKAGRALTANQRIALAAQVATSRPGATKRPTYTTQSGETRTTAQVLANAQRNLAAGRALTANQAKALGRAVGVKAAAPKPAARPAAARPAAKPTYTTKTGQTRTTKQVLTNARQNLAAGRSLTANQTAALRQQATPKPRPAARPTPRPAPKPAPKPAPRPAAKRTYTTKTGQTRTTKQVLANAAQNRATGRPLTANQQAALRQQAKPAPKPTPKRPAAAPRPAPKPTPKPAPRPAPRPAPKPAPRPAPKPTPRPAPKPAPKPKPKPKPTYTTQTGQVRTQAQVLANAKQNQKAGRPLTANQVKALAAKRKKK